MSDDARTAPSIDRAEHDEVASAKRVVDYGCTGTVPQRMPTPLLDLAYDYVGFSNADGNGNYQTVVYKTGGSGGTTVRTLTYTFDGSSNVTSITRT